MLNEVTVSTDVVLALADMTLNHLQRRLARGHLTSVSSRRLPVEREHYAECRLWVEPGGRTRACSRKRVCQRTEPDAGTRATGVCPFVVTVSEIVKFWLPIDLYNTVVVQPHRMRQLLHRVWV